MKRASIATLILIGLLFVGVQAQATIAWESVPVQASRILADGQLVATVPAGVREWTIPTALRNTRRFVVEACNTIGACAPSAPLDIPPPSAWKQVVILGNTVPTSDTTVPPPPPPPGAITGLFPDNNATGVSTSVTISCTATWATTFTLLIGTVNPPTTGPAASGACGFPQSLSESTTYYYKITAANDTSSVDSSVLTFTTVTPITANLLTSGITVSSAGKFTRGLVLPSGVSFGGVQLVDSSGVGITTQSDVKTTWDDGSIRFVVVSADIADVGVYNVVDSTEAAGTIAAPTVPDVRVEFVVYPLEGGAGTSHTAEAPASMSADCWLDGPVALECRDEDTLDNSPTGHAQYLTVYFDRRVYADGESRVDVMVNNMQRVNTIDATGALVYTAEVFINDVSVYTLGSAPVAGPCNLTTAGSRLTCTNHGLDEGDYVIISDPTNASYRRFARVLQKTANTADYYGTGIGGAQAAPGVSWVKTSKLHPEGSRWRLPAEYRAANGYTEAVAQMDYSSLLAAKALPSYLPTIANTPTIMSGVGARCWARPSGNTVDVAPSADPTRYDWCWEPLAIGDHQPFMAGPGARDEIGGIIPGLYTRYFVHRTAALRENMLRQADLAATWRVHAVHPGTNSMVDLNDVPNMCGDPSNCPAGNVFHGGATHLGYTAEIGAAHHPGMAYLPYLDTGDRFYMEELKHWANWGGSSFSSGRSGSQGLLTGQQVRGGAWALRDYANNANYLPDDDEHKAYFATLVQNNLTNFDARVAIEEAKDPAVKQWYIGNTQCRTLPGYCTGEFMNAYLALCLQHVIRQGGFTGGETARNYLVDFLIATYIHTGWRQYANVFHHHSRIAATNTPFASFEEMYNYNFTTVSPGTDPPRINGTALQPTPWQYGAQYRIALVVGLSTGRPDAQAAYDYNMLNAAMVDHITKRSGEASAGFTVNAGSQAGIASVD